MAYKIEYSSDSKILIRSFKGSVSFEEMLNSCDELVRNHKLDPPVIGVLDDFIYAELLMNRENLAELMNLFQEHLEIFERIKLAVVMVIPENIVFPVLASQNYPQFKIEAFSTVEAAERWLRAD
jgi:hypothetical protein